MFGAESTDNLYFSVSAGQLGKGLDEQLARFVAEHPYTKLIIIDTLQKVREVGGDNYSYANDYQIMARLKSFADVPCLCMLLVHHTRKQNADDKFDMISGTSGLLGAADGAFLLQKEKRTGNAATLEVSGRDQQDQKLYLVRNTETLLWDLQRAETELLSHTVTERMDGMKNVQISQELFMQLLRFHLMEDVDCETEIKRELEKKLDKMVMRDLYGKFKTAPTEEEREQARKEYLDRRGVPESFRW